MGQQSVAAIRTFDSHTEVEFAHLSFVTGRGGDGLSVWATLGSDQNQAMTHETRDQLVIYTRGHLPG